MAKGTAKASDTLEVGENEHYDHIRECSGAEHNADQWNRHGHPRGPGRAYGLPRDDDGGGVDLPPHCHHPNERGDPGGDPGLYRRLQSDRIDVRARRGGRSRLFVLRRVLVVVPSGQGILEPADSGNQAVVQQGRAMAYGARPVPRPTSQPRAAAGLRSPIGVRFRRRPRTARVQRLTLVEPAARGGPAPSLRVP